MGSRRWSQLRDGQLQGLSAADVGNDVLKERPVCDTYDPLNRLPALSGAKTHGSPSICISGSMRMMHDGPNRRRLLQGHESFLVHSSSSDGQCAKCSEQAHVHHIERFTICVPTCLCLRLIALVSAGTNAVVAGSGRPMHCIRFQFAVH